MILLGISCFTFKGTTVSNASSSSKITGLLINSFWISSSFIGLIIWMSSGVTVRLMRNLFSYSSSGSSSSSVSSFVKCVIKLANISWKLGLCNITNTIYNKTNINTSVPISPIL